MNFDFTEEQLLIQKTARDYAERTLAPRAAERDESKEFPVKELRELAELGLLGVTVPEEHGGAGADAIGYSLALQELARGDASDAVAVSVTNMVAELVAKRGTKEQIEEHVSKLLDGTYITGSFALSEPQAGSDPSAMQTVAKKVEGGYELSGSKQWVTSGDRSGLLVVWAVTDKDSKRNALSAFLVRGDAKGVGVVRLEEKMGLAGSSTAQISLDKVFVADKAVLGDLGDGFRLAMMALDSGRIGIASQALGISSFALERATTYALERETFGKPIAKHQAIGNMLADAATHLDAGKMLTYRAADAKQRGLPFTEFASRAKLFASEKACQICDVALQIHGGFGYTKDFPIERAYRDARVTRIYEGTSEIQRIVIARGLIKRATT